MVVLSRKGLSAHDSKPQALCSGGVFPMRTYPEAFTLCKCLILGRRLVGEVSYNSCPCKIWKRGMQVPGLGTIINVAAIAVAGLLGAGVGKLMGERLREGLVKASGVCVLFIGAAGALSGMFSVDGGTPSPSNSRHAMTLAVRGQQRQRGCDRG